MKKTLFILVLAAITGCSGLTTMNTRKTGNIPEVDNTMIKISGKNVKDNVIYLPIASHEW